MMAIHGKHLVLPEEFEPVTDFDWVCGNAMKNTKHDVADVEAEQLFTNEPLLVLEDPAQSESERRWHALGRTHEGRLLHVSFTLRDADTRIRVISARSMHRKERIVYGKAAQEGS